jgi:hypothetical protein
MSPDEDHEDGDVYEPEPVSLVDGEVLIFDKADFEQEFNCFAARNLDGYVEVLCRGTRKWVPAEGRGSEPSKPKGSLTRVK